MAAISLARGDTANAEAHELEAVKLDPQDENSQVNLAALQARTGSPAVRADAVRVLHELSARPDNPLSALAALRSLLRDAMEHGESIRAKELAAALAAAPQAVFVDQLTRLTTLWALEDPQATPFLLHLRDGAASKPDDLFQLMTCMNAHHRGLLVLEWLPELPPTTVARPPVCIGVADARARNSEWQKIEDTLFAASWGEYDHFREAFRARALDHLGSEEIVQASAAWTAAVVAARKRAGALECLVRLAMSWGWEQRSEEALWKLVATEPCPRWVRDRLWAIALARRDTPQLHALAMLRVKTDPRSLESRNDAIFLALLLRSKEAGLHDGADALAKEAAGHPNVAATAGLSLFQRKRAAEAVALMEKFTPGQIREPTAARYFGIFLSATARRAEAGEFLRLGEQGLVLPEESALMKSAQVAARRVPSPESR